MGNFKDGGLKIQFLGGAETVTGSKFLIKNSGQKILVDCGLFQGLKKLRLKNREPLPVNPGDIDLVILTHAHLDHTGYLPRLVKDGFVGPVYCTQPTKDITNIILEDSAKIQEEEAEKANKEGYSVHEPAKPLYDRKDVDMAMKFFRTCDMEEWIDLENGGRFRFKQNGHVLGSAFVELEAGGKRFVFSGDVGRPVDPLMFKPLSPVHADYLIIESTYGDRLHPDEDVHERLAQIINETYKKGGMLIIPSFVLERSQYLMHELWVLKKRKKIPDIPVYMDSPMGADITSLFLHYKNWLNLDPKKCVEMFNSVKIIRSYNESLENIADERPKIIIAGSGMVTGGRVLGYLEKYLEKETTTVLLVGFQAEGTRGRAIEEGDEEVKIHGKFYKVKARVEKIDSISAHADREELMTWMGGLSKKPDKVFIVHGEPQAADAFRVKISTEKKWDCVVPSINEEFELD